MPGSGSPAPGGIGDDMTRFAVLLVLVAIALATLALPGSTDASRVAAVSTTIQVGPRSATAKSATATRGRGMQLAARVGNTQHAERARHPACSTQSACAFPQRPQGTTRDAGDLLRGAVVLSGASPSLIPASTRHDDTGPKTPPRYDQHPPRDPSAAESSLTQTNGGVCVTAAPPPALRARGRASEVEVPALVF